MYRGVVQAGGIWSAYLTDYIKSHDLELPVGKGRIWRVVYGAGRRGARPRPRCRRPRRRSWCRRCRIRRAGGATRRSGCSSNAATSPWCRRSRRWPATAPDWRTRLHALWTLDGLDAIEVAQVEKALTDANADVRASAVRLSERWLGQDPALAAKVLKLQTDKNWNVRRQLAASLGELPAPARVDPAVAILTTDGADPIIVDAATQQLERRRSGRAGARVPGRRPRRRRPKPSRC